MKLSIIMLAYNHEKFISDAIEGVLLQKTNFPFELIVANDHSTDNTEQLVAAYRMKYPEIVKGFDNTKNLGPGFNFIKAYGEATGDYIAMCEGDDYWTDPFKLQRQFDFLETNNDYNLTFHDIVMIDGNGNAMMNDRLPLEDKKDYKKDELLIGPYLPTPTLFFRNFDVKKYSAAFERAFNGDTLLLSILTQEGKTKYLANIAGSCVRVHSEGVWSSKSNLDRWNCSLKTKQIIFHSLDNKRKKYVFENFRNVFEMAVWTADFYKSKKYWIQYTLKYFSFLLAAHEYGKTWLIARRIAKRILRK